MALAWQYVPEVVEEGLEVLLHLNGVVLRLCDAEDPHLAVLPGAVLHEEEGEQHEEAAVVHDPPDVDVALHLVTRVGEPLQDEKTNDSSHICSFKVHVSPCSERRRSTTQPM